MNISSLKDLKKLLVLCRQQGVQSIKLGEIEFHLGSLPNKPGKRMAEVLDEAFPEAQIQVPKFTPVNDVNTVQQAADQIATDGLTDEQLLYYSAQGHTEQANN